MQYHILDTDETKWPERTQCRGQARCAHVLREAPSSPESIHDFVIILSEHHRELRPLRVAAREVQSAVVGAHYLAGEAETDAGTLALGGDVGVEVHVQQQHHVRPEGLHRGDKCLR